MELKTLKDIKPFMRGTSIVEFDYIKEKMKEEAINWMKNWIKEGKSSGTAKQDLILGSKFEAFEEFFNITEEDLK